MNEELLDRWERDFRAAARTDGYAMFRDHLRRLQLSELHNHVERDDEPQSMVDATVCAVRACSGHSALDGQADAFRRFLEMQEYNPAGATDARYVFTFDLFGKAFARVLARAEERILDLADLYGTPWAEYRVVGFHHFWISHPDWSPLTNEELQELQDEVSDDLRFDYGEDEIEFWFDDSLDEAYLFVTVRDVLHVDVDSDD